MQTVDMFNFPELDQIFQQCHLNSFCSPIILQFVPENSFDSVQIGVSNQSWNKGGVKI